MSHAARRHRFTSWFEKTYGEGEQARSKLIADSGLTKGRVSQLFDKREAFGETAARQLAQRLGLEEDIFLRDLSDLAFNAGLMLDEISSEAEKKKVYALWANVHQLITSGQPVNIVIGVGASPSHAEPVPRQAQR